MCKYECTDIYYIYIGMYVHVSKKVRTACSGVKLVNAPEIKL